MTKHYDKMYGSKPPQNYERFFVPTIGEPVAKDLIRKAELQPGEHVLDVACGTGIIARLALQQVGETGSVTGLDINPGMLAVARSVTQNSSIEWHEASAEDMPFPDDSFDVVICQLGIQFMEDRSAALQEMYRVLMPGGRMFLNVPGPAGEPFVIFAEEMGKNISPEAKKFANHVFVLNDTGEIRQLINGAGFSEVDVQAKKKNISLPAPRDFLWQYVQSTPLAGVLAEADEEAKATLEENVVDQWQDFVDDGAFMYEQRLVTASAKK
jgi:ubiquinone/menaquinone biosynthesis C-methylase UbiE